MLRRKSSTNRNTFILQRITKGNPRTSFWSPADQRRQLQKRDWRMNVIHEKYIYVPNCLVIGQTFSEFCVAIQIYKQIYPHPFYAVYETLLVMVHTLFRPFLSPSC